MLSKVSSLLADRVFIQILNMSITASIIILVVLLVRVLLKKAPKIFSYALWGIVLFRLLCPISFSSSVSVFNLLNLPKVDSGEMTFLSKEQMNDVVKGNRDQNQNINLTPHIPDYVGFKGHQPLNEEAFEGNSSENDVDKITNEIVEKNEYPEEGFGDDNLAEINGSVGNINYDNQSASSESVTYNHQNLEWTYFLCIIWMLGILVLVSINTIRNIRLRKKVSASLRLRENIYLCDDIQVPFCMGVINPKIYLPSILEKDEMEYIILHEKHHIKRFDHFVKLLAFLALCIHWLNPLVWVSFALAGRDMEMSCDEAIMRKMDIRAKYSASLLQLATGRKVFTSSTLSFGEGNPKQRIKNIMNYKKPAFWVILVSIMGCVLVSIALLSNPIPKENISVSEDESINGSEESQHNTVSAKETTESGDSLEHTERSRFHPEYERLIQLAEEILRDPSKAQKKYERYVDEKGTPLFSSDFYINNDPSQELGYLVQDINGDGIKELMLGVNFLDGEYEEHFILDLYTLKNEKAVHVFDGWWRNRYYPTDKGNFINFGTASADEHGYVLYQFDGEKLNEGEEISEKNLEKYDIVYPYFIPFGADWEELEDIDGNGQPEYVVYYGEDNAHDEFVYAFNMEKIYRHNDLDFVEVCDTKYMDLDHDEDKEVVIIMDPHVNSMPLAEYAVIKEKNGAWKKLEMYQGEDILSNSFPISIVKGEGQFDAKLSVDGLDKEIIINFENRYNYWKRAAEDSVEYASLEQTVKNYYDRELLSMQKNSVCAYTSSWGVWDIQYGTYKEQDCLIAEQGIEGYGKDDFWGNVFIYFDYDLNGKIRILDFTFIPYEEEYVSSSVRSQGFREVDGNVDFQQLSADIRFDSDSRKFYFSSQGVETSDGFDIMPYWDYILNTARMDDSEDSLYHRYSLFLGGEMDEEEYPGQFYPGEWQVETQDTYFVAYRQVYGFEQFPDLWGRMKVTFSLSEQGNITVRKVAFIPTDSMKRLAGQYSGGDYMESYQEIIKAYKTFAEEIKESWELATAYQVAGPSYICEEYAAAVSTGTPVYLIDDMNQDGIPELFIGIRDNQGNTNIYDAYTWNNNSSYQLLRGIGYRNGTCILCEDGIIKNITSGSNGEYRIEYQTLPHCSITLETFEKLDVFRDDTGAYTYEYQGKIISKNEADRIMEKYREADLKPSNMH